jgi:hypothetical protein
MKPADAPAMTSLRWCLRFSKREAEISAAAEYDTIAVRVP